MFRTLHSTTQNPISLQLAASPMDTADWRVLQWAKQDIFSSKDSAAISSQLGGGEPSQCQCPSEPEDFILMTMPPAIHACVPSSYTLSVTSSIPQSYSLCGPSPTPLSSSLSLPCHCSHHLPSPLPSFSTSPSQSVSLSRPRPPSSPSSPAAPWLPFHLPCSWELANSTAPLSSVQGPSVHCCCSARQRQYAAVSPSTKRHGSLDLALQEKSKLRIDEKFI